MKRNDLNLSARYLSHVISYLDLIGLIENWKWGAEMAVNEYISKCYCNYIGFLSMILVGIIGGSRPWAKWEGGGWGGGGGG